MAAAQMTEAGRLKQMPDNFDVILFNDLFNRTYPLMRKLCGQINSDMIGLGYDDILSDFSVKFLQVFNRYYDTHHKDKEKFLAFMINSLYFYKNRILRKLYAESSKVYNCIELEDANENHSFLEIDVHYEREQNLEIMTGLIVGFMKENLRPDAFLIFELDTWPPEGLLSILHQKRKRPNPNNIPASYLAEYLGLDDNPKTIKEINKLRKDVQIVRELAKDEFKDLVL